MKPKYDAWKKEEDAKAAVAAEAQRKADEESARAAKAAQARAAAVARAKVHRAYDGRDPDGQCQADGKPPYREDYTGGTYDENEMVALSDGCVHLFERHSTRSPNDNTFCCPR